MEFDEQQEIPDRHRRGRRYSDNRFGAQTGLLASAASCISKRVSISCVVRDAVEKHLTADIPLFAKEERPTQ